jgi:hypothetical protein
MLRLSCINILRTSEEKHLRLINSEVLRFKTQGRKTDCGEPIHVFRTPIVNIVSNFSIFRYSIFCSYTSLCHIIYTPAGTEFSIVKDIMLCIGYLKGRTSKLVYSETRSLNIIRHDKKKKNKLVVLSNTFYLTKLFSRIRTTSIFLGITLRRL